MAGPFKKVTSSNPGIDHTDARYVYIPWTNGTVTVTPTIGKPAMFPNFTLNVVPVVNGTGVMTVPVGGNYSGRIFANTAIDNINDLSVYPAKFPIRWMAYRVYRVIASEALGSNERHFQYGDQGSSAGQTGGWVIRMNSATSSSGTIRCITAALHWPDPYGALADDLVSISTRDISIDNGAYTSVTGHFVMMAVDSSATVGNVLRLYVDDDAVVLDGEATLYPFPGKSTVTPINDGSSAGMTLMAQSTNQGTNSARAGSIWPFHFGEAQNVTHLNELIVKLKAAPFANPYSRA